MNKDIFNLWNIEKNKINNREMSDVYINHREIWFTKMVQNIGFEENGKKEFSRPVIPAYSLCFFKKKLFSAIIPL